MSRPASLVIRPIPRGKPTGQKLGLDMERIDLSFNHRSRAEENIDTLHNLRLELIDAERTDRYSKAKKLRREINHLLEEGLYLTHSFCGSCQNVLHRCHC